MRGERSQISKAIQQSIEAFSLPSPVRRASCNTSEVEVHSRLQVLPTGGLSRSLRTAKKSVKVEVTCSQCQCVACGKLLRCEPREASLSRLSAQTCPCFFMRWL